MRRIISEASFYYAGGGGGGGGGERERWFPNVEYVPLTRVDFSLSKNQDFLDSLV